MRESEIGEVVAQPLGTVTLVFTDIDGSTRLLRELGQEVYQQELTRHRSVVREAFRRHGGYEVDYEGDAFFYSFATAREAVQAVIEAQAGLADGPIRIRVGIHTGEPGLDPPKYVGLDVHVAARIMSAGHGGQVLLSHSTRALVDIDVTELGEHRLKDVTAPVPLYQLGSGSFPPLKTTSITNLPRPPSALIGREQETAAVTGLVRASRLVTLTGPGGMGKTRLAIEVASELVGEFKSGVFWIGLATLRDPALVVETIGPTLGAKGDLAEHVGEREMLLLLDNFEQVVEAAAELSALLQTCPNLHLLVTSRELLRIDGEAEYPVPPLASGQAVELFCTRSRLHPDETISELCRRLDDMPLAVELAAARTSVMSTAQILDRLSTRLDLFKGGRDADPRQQTLRTTIEWSHDLLTPEEQRLFARFSVFAGGCTLEAAEDVLDADVDSVQALVEKSLLRNMLGRLGMLETIRDFATERLERDGEAHELRSRHAAFFLTLAERAHPGLLTGEQKAWLDRIEPELDNIRAALEWFQTTGEIARELRLLAGLIRLWYTRVHLSEARRRLEDALRRAPAEPSRALRRVLMSASTVAWEAGDVEAAKTHALRELDVARALGDGLDIGSALNSLGQAEYALGQLDAAEQHFAESVEFAESEDGDPSQLTVALANLGMTKVVRREYTAARALLERSIELDTGMGDSLGVGASTCALGWALMGLGDMEAAESRFLQSLGIADHLGWSKLSGECLQGLVVVAAATARPHQAAVAAGMEAALRETHGFQPEAEPYRLADEALQEVAVELGSEAFSEAVSSGRSLPADAATAEALLREAKLNWQAQTDTPPPGR